jgi:4a-hydroxytetrahydrobiopterin dehydratase
MTPPSKLDPADVDAWLTQHPAWRRDGEALVATFEVADFSAALAIGVRLGMLAEKRDHHPDLRIGWGKIEVLWTTHHAGGITRLDLELAAATEALAA